MTTSAAAELGPGDALEPIDMQTVTDRLYRFIAGGADEAPTGTADERGDALVTAAATAPAPGADGTIQVRFQLALQGAERLRLALRHGIAPVIPGPETAGAGGHPPAP